SSWRSAPSSSAARAGCGRALGLAFLVDAEDHGMGRWIDIKANDILELVGKSGVVGELERAHPMGLQPVALPDAPHRGRTDPTVLAIAGALQWGGAWLVSATTRSTVSTGSGGMREGRVLSRVNPSIPSCMKRSC